MTIHSDNRPDDGQYLIESLRIIKKYKRVIAVVTGAALVLSVIVSLLLPKVYVARTSVLPPAGESSLGLNVASRITGDLGSLAEGVIGGQSKADLWVGILKSRNVKEAVADRLGLMGHYRSDSMEKVVRALGERVSMRKDKNEIISLIAEDSEPEMAASIANAFIEELDRVNRDIVMTSGKRSRIFVEERLAQARQDLTEVEEELKAFQEANNAVKLDDQAFVIMEAIGAVKGELMAREIELQTLLSYATRSNPRVQILKAQIDETRSRLRELEGGGNPNGDKGIFIPTKEMPSLALRYARLLRKAKTQETLFELLVKQYEMSKIMEVKDSPTVQVLDVAKVPERRDRPKRRQIVMISVIGGALFSVLLAFFLEYAERLRKAVADMEARG